MTEVTFALEIGMAVEHSVFGMKGVVQGLFLDRDNKRSVYVKYKLSDGKLETAYWREEDIGGTKPLSGV